MLLFPFRSIEVWWEMRKPLIFNSPWLWLTVKRRLLVSEFTARWSLCSLRYSYPCCPGFFRNDETKNHLLSKQLFESVHLVWASVRSVVSSQRLNSWRSVCGSISYACSCPSSIVVYSVVVVRYSPLVCGSRVQAITFQFRGIDLPQSITP